MLEIVLIRKELKTNLYRSAAQSKLIIDIINWDII